MVNIGCAGYEAFSLKHHRAWAALSLHSQIQFCVINGERSSCTNSHYCIGGKNGLACLYFFKLMTIFYGGAKPGIEQQ